MLAIVPVKDIDASAVPSPVMKLKPVSWASVSTPLLAVSVTRTLFPAASISPMLIWLPLPDEKTRLVSSLVLWAPGTVLIGASLTAFTVMLAVAVALLKAVIPPLVVVSGVLPAVPLGWS